MGRKKGRDPIFEDKTLVYWEFECGCKYEGKRYKIGNKRLCIKHQHCAIVKEFKICAECEEKHEVSLKSAHRKYCDVCQPIVKEEQLSLKNSKKRTCSRPKCTNFVGDDNYFLCNSCYNKYRTVGTSLRKKVVRKTLLDKLEITNKWDVLWEKIHRDHIRRGGVA